MHTTQDGPLPFADAAFDLVTSRHPVVPRWTEIARVREARPRIEIRDVAAVVYLLRKLVWWVPDFTVEKYRDRLGELHELIGQDGPFIAHSTRHLIEARRSAAQTVDPR